MKNNAQNCSKRKKIAKKVIIKQTKLSKIKKKDGKINQKQKKSG